MTLERFALEVGIGALGFAVGMEVRVLVRRVMQWARRRFGRRNAP